MVLLLSFVMETINGITYCLIKYTSRSVYYEIAIDGIKKRIRFRKSRFGFRSVKAEVYVSIDEKKDTPYTIPNRVRRAFIYLVQNENITEPILCRFYTVRNIQAEIICWADSKRGEHLKYTEALDFIDPTPDVSFLQYVRETYDAEFS
jgi:hypothetical protein